MKKLPHPKKKITLTVKYTVCPFYWQSCFKSGSLVYNIVTRIIIRFGSIRVTLVLVKVFEFQGLNMSDDQRR